MIISWELFCVTGKAQIIDEIGKTEQLIKNLLDVEGVKVVLSCRGPLDPGRNTPKGEGEY